VSADAAQQPFSRRGLIVLLVAGIVGFIAFLLLSAYAPDMQSGRDGGTHAMSTAATGFRALYKLNEAAQGSSYLIRDKGKVESADLFVLTPRTEGDAKKVAELAKERMDDEEAGPTLIILPKWQTMTDPKRRDWVISLGPLSRESIAAILKDLADDVQLTRHGHKGVVAADWPGHAGVRFSLPVLGQSIGGEAFEPIIADPAGGAVLARLKAGNVYVLADPDLANNLGLKNKDNARAVLQMLWDLNPDDAGTISFDVTVPGLGRAPNLLKLAFEPPFLAVTLCLFVAALLAGLHAVVRFGPALGEVRLIAFGKAALLDNSADLLRRAGHEHRGGERYVILTRDAVAQAVGVPSDLAAEKIDHYLDRLATSGGQSWSDLAQRVAQARTRNELVRAARALHDWRKDVTRGNR